MHILQQKIAAACSKRARRKEARPAELLAAALDLFVEKGFAATRVEEVAARAGVSKGTLFLYYKSKEELFKAVVRECIGSHYEGWNAELEAFTGDTRELLSYGIQSWWSRVGESKGSGITKLMLCEAQNFPDLALFYQHEVIEPGRALIRRILERGIARGELRVPNVDYAIYAVLAPVIFLTLTQHSASSCLGAAEPLNPAQYIHNHIDTLLHGISVAHQGNY